MCCPKIGEDLDEEDEVSDRAQRTIGAIALNKRTNFNPMLCC
jgi:hypothetical protein